MLFSAKIVEDSSNTSRELSSKDSDDKLSVSDFECLKIIGKGAFGKVRYYSPSLLPPPPTLLLTPGDASAEEERPR
jgi:hypothetical protein